jgi:hypothetical protein
MDGVTYKSQANYVKNKTFERACNTPSAPDTDDQ